MFRASRDLILRVPPDQWPAALRFYGEVLGFAPVPASGMAGFDAGALRLYLEPGDAHAAVLDFLVEDVAAAKAALLQAGCTLIEEDPRRPRCYLRDPYGLIFNLGRAAAPEAATAAGAGAAPTLAHGKICYLELPARDPAAAAAFYAAVFGWRMRRRGNGVLAFDDSTGQVSGAFVSRSAAASPGLLFYIMVADAAATCRDIEAHGGAIVQAIGADDRELTARFKDPAGNLLGLYQPPAG